MTIKKLTLHDVQINEDGTVRVVTDLSPDEMKVLLTVGLLACMQHGVMLASLAEKLGYTQTHQIEVEDQTDSPDWEQMLDGEKSKNA